MRLESLIPRARRTPKRGRPGDDVKQIKVSKAIHTFLYMYAKKRGMTFGDAATHLIVVGVLHEFDLYDDMKQQLDVREQEALNKAVLSRMDGTAQSPL